MRVGLQGITAVAPAEVARGLGVDLIITDHHTPPASMDDLPDAFAVVHPRRPDSSYPFGDLPGAGVAYKLAWRLATMSCASERVTDALRDLLVEMLAPASLGGWGRRLAPQPRGPEKLLAPARGR